jgi:hypothetical protein
VRSPKVLGFGIEATATFRRTPFGTIPLGKNFLRDIRMYGALYLLNYSTDMMN